MNTEFSVYSKLANLAGYASSMQGGRPENQDDLGFLDTPLGFLFVLCDGMGGGPGGKTASEIAKREIAASINICNSLTPPDKALTKAFVRAHEALESRMKEEPSLEGMGTTAVALLIGKESAYVAHAGDSRLYHLRDGELVWRSTDHSIVSELTRMKAMTEEQARTSPQSNVITRGLGATSNHTPDIKKIDYEQGDRFVLCSDGTWEMFPARELILKLAQKGHIDTMVKALQQEIDSLGERQGGGHDNHSIAVIDVMDYSQKKLDMIKKMKTAIVVLCALCSIFLLSNILTFTWMGRKTTHSVEDIQKEEQNYKTMYYEAEQENKERTRTLEEQNENLKSKIKEQDEEIKKLERKLGETRKELEEIRKDKEPLEEETKADEANEPDTYIVKKGDSLSKIANKFKTTVEKLKRLNKKKDEKIKPGETIRVR